MKTVAVLMSTYNGEKYIREQVYSILNQKDVEVNLYIRDDGSTDKTLDILSEFKKSILRISKGENLRPARSFMELLYSVPDNYDYYALSDQDDIWEENKLIEAIIKLEDNKKMLYTSNQLLVDSLGNSLGLKYSPNYTVDVSPIGVFRTNCFTGCTMVMTQHFRKIICLKEHRPESDIFKLKMHDEWLAFIASIYDGLYYDRRSFIYYRQHENNVIGAIPQKNNKLYRFKNFINGKSRKFHSGIVSEAFKKFPEQTRNYPFIELCANTKTFRQKTILIRQLKKIFADKFRVSLYFRVLFNLF